MGTRLIYTFVQAREVVVAGWVADWISSFREKHLSIFRLFLACHFHENKTEVKPTFLIGLPASRLQSSKEKMAPLESGFYDVMPSYSC